MDLLDEFVRKNIARKNSNQKKLIDLIKLRFKNGGFLKQNGNLHLQAACRVKKNNIVDFLIKSGADVNFRNMEGESAINFAVLHFRSWVRSKLPHVRILMDKLIQQGAMLSMQDNLGLTVLHKWAYDERQIFPDYKYSEMILEYLLQHNASVDLIDIEGNNVLMYAALHCRTRFMMLLETTSKPPPLGRSFIIDQQNFAGETCAHLLVMSQHERRKNCTGSDDYYNGDLLNYLIRKGASLYVENNAGETVIDYILKCRYGNDGIRKMLYKHTYKCMLAFLMGTHSRLGAKSHVRHLDDIALDLILREIRNLLKSIVLNSYRKDYVASLDL